MARKLSIREKILEYFVAPKPTFPTKPFIIGILLTIILIYLLNITNFDKYLVIGILGSLLISVIPFLTFLKKNHRYKSRPSDNQMDIWLWNDFKNIIENDALAKLGLDKSELVAESLVIPGPIYWDNVYGINKSEILRKLGFDYNYRYSIWNIQIFIFTENFLANYGCYYNWIRNTSINECTNEFFYKDVISIKTSSQSTAYTLVNGSKLEHSQIFQLKLPGDEIFVITNDSELKVSSEMTSRADKAIQSIRSMLRQKKT
ncbi:MAG: hypothetical protein K9N09_07585 [Candidatus Cloacimonetes bacterium]|nr:hypothetical protein [Candidatus Cloacimonadota bacterium]MCF8357076.1 hypothetical protein [Melioribacteraceae bacterium]